MSKHSTWRVDRTRQNSSIVGLLPEWTLRTFLICARLPSDNDVGKRKQVAGTTLDLECFCKNVTFPSMFLDRIQTLRHAVADYVVDLIKEARGMES